MGLCWLSFGPPPRPEAQTNLKLALWPFEGPPFHG
jgi:hypothetical protein